MESQSEVNSSRLDTPLLAAAVLLIVGGLFAFYYLQPRLDLLPRLGILAVLVAAGVVSASRTQLGRTVWTALVGARVELRKVVWPGRQESIQVTLFVAVVVLVLALFLWGIDSLLILGIHQFLGGVA